MTAPDLLPCPFCGGEARKWQDPSHSAAWFIGCDDGDRDCFGSINWAETEAEAIAAWNTRATPAAMTPEVRALVDAVERLLPVARHYGGLTDEHVAAIMDAEATIRNFRNVSTVKHSLTTDAALAALREGGEG